MRSFSKEADDDLVAWKLDELQDLDCPSSPYSKNPDGPVYDTCLPLEFAHYNLLPEAQEAALERFRKLGIRWHDGTPVGPSNHLRSSQVQCVNALMPFVNDPAALRALFGGSLPIAEVIRSVTGRHPTTSSCSSGSASVTTSTRQQARPAGVVPSPPVPTPRSATEPLTAASRSR
jgi:hypothetical protein